MELDDYQTLNNLDPARLTGGRGKQKELKPEHGVRSVEPVRGKRSSLVFYILLGLSILLSVVILGTAVILFPQTFSEMKASVADFKMELSQMKSNITELSETRSSLAEFRTEISQLKENLPRSQCPDQWGLFKQKLYYISSSGKTWDEAQESCKSMDADLAVINSAEEQVYLQWNIRDDHWIGLHDSIEEGKWRWVDGTDYASTAKFWASGQPHSHESEDEDCVVASKTGAWHDWPCSSKHSSICEKSA